MKRTAVHDIHKRLGAKLVDFAGWEMPLLYTGIREEHQHTRSVSSIFDVSHMGRLIFTGPDAAALLDRVCTRNAAALAVGRCGYSHVCNEQGGILDDVIISRAETHWIMVCNAANRERILAHVRDLAAGRNVEIEDHTELTVMFAIQGPATWRLFREHLPIQVGDLKRYAFVTGSYMGMPYTLFRSGYTGEDGLEIILPAAAGPLAWEYVTQEGGEERPTIRPAGLGARDTLRLEAGMPLYGHELHERPDPLSAGCEWAVDLSKDFIGAEALRRIKAEGPKRRLAGLVLEGRRIARQGAAVYEGTRVIGEVTSGTFGLTVGKSIAMAYLDTGAAEQGRRVEVDVHDERAAATVGPTQFYKRASGE
jgi:aminomethyltransferase